MIDDTLLDAEERMDKALSVAREDLGAVRTGRAAPSMFNRIGSVVGVPTVDLTVHLRAELPPAHARDDDWYLVTFRSRVAAEGFAEEDGELWSRDGRLLAQSRQLALVMAARA